MTNKEKLREAKKVLLKNGYSFIKNSNKYSVPEATQESISEAYNYLNEAAAIDFFKEKIKQIKNAFKSAKSSGDKSGAEEAKAEAKELQSKIKSSSLSGAVKKGLLVALAAIAFGAGQANAASCFTSMEKGPDGTHYVEYGDCADMADVEADLMSFGNGSKDGGNSQQQVNNEFEKLLDKATFVTYNGKNQKAYFGVGEYLAKLYNNNTPVKIIDSDVKAVNQEKGAQYDVYTFNDGAQLYIPAGGQQNYSVLKSPKGNLYKVICTGRGGIHEFAENLANK